MQEHAKCGPAEGHINPDGGLARQGGLNQLVHDLKQPLTAIGNYAKAGSYLIDAGLSDTARLKELFEKIAVQCERGTCLSRELGAAVSALQADKPAQTGSV